jgi:hypothetical protein
MEKSAVYSRARDWRGAEQTRSGAPEMRPIFLKKMVKTRKKTKKIFQN